MDYRSNGSQRNGDGAPGLVGRTRERAVLHDHLARSVAGSGRLVLVRGKAGIGKTALIDDLARNALDQAVLVLTGHCYDQTVIRPYGPWIEVARDYETILAHSATPSERVPKSLPQLWGEGQSSAASSQVALFESVVTFLSGASDWRPLCLVLEDLHWSDQASVDLLLFVGRQISRLPLLVVATYRDDELTPDFPLYQRLPNLVRETGAERITVHPLSRLDLSHLVSERYALPDTDVERLVAMLEDLTQGNALYASEMLRSLEEERILCQERDSWHLRDVTHVHVPELLREVIDGRLARLSREARSALQIAAVIGQEVPLDLWRTVCQLDDAALLDIADEAFETHILEEGSAIDRPRFHHTLIREALVESLHGPRRRLWHQRIAEAHAAARPPEPDRVAHHFQQANDPRAVDWLIEAGRRAQLGYAWIEAAEHYEAAARWLEGNSERARERGWLLYRIGSLRRYGDPRRGLLAMQDALLVAEQADDPLLTLLASFYAGHHQHSLGDMRRGIVETTAACRRADAALRTGAFDNYQPPPLWTSDPSASIEAHRQAARSMAHQPDYPICIPWGTVTIYLAWLGYLAEARAIGDQLATLWPPTPETVPKVSILHGTGGSAWADLYHGLGLANALSGLPAEASGAFAAARAIYESVDHQMLIGDIFAHELELVLLPYRTDEPDERRRVTERAAAVYARVSGAVASAANMPLVAATCWLAQADGNWEEIDVAAAAYAATAGTVSWWRIKLGTLLAIVARNRGHAEAAWAYVREVLPQETATQPGDVRLTYVLTLQGVAAELAMDAGDLRVAETWLAARDRWIEWSGIIHGRSEGQLLWARFHHLAGDAAAARHHARAAHQLASEPRQPLALLMAHRTIGELETAAGHADEAANHLDQALALATTIAMPYERAQSLLALAELRAASSRRDEARALLADARAICEPLGATLALARADSLVARLAGSSHAREEDGLSRREVEVLRLIAAGKSNRAIADELGMSVRTAERHIANAYIKLGVETRAEAIAYALQHDLH